MKSIGTALTSCPSSYQMRPQLTLVSILQEFKNQNQHQLVQHGMARHLFMVTFRYGVRVGPPSSAMVASALQAASCTCLLWSSTRSRIPCAVQTACASRRHPSLEARATAFDEDSHKQSRRQQKFVLYCENDARFSSQRRRITGLVFPES